MKSKSFFDGTTGRATAGIRRGRAGFADADAVDSVTHGAQMVWRKLGRRPVNGVWPNVGRRTKTDPVNANMVQLGNCERTWCVESDGGITESKPANVVVLPVRKMVVNGFSK